MRPPRSIGDETALEARCAHGVPAEGSRPTRPGPTGGARVVLPLLSNGEIGRKGALARFWATRLDLERQGHVWEGAETFGHALQQQ